jgi:hypothetical protein
VGLDTTHDCWVGSYTHFGMWRQEVARAAGYALKQRADAPWPIIDLPDDLFTQETFVGDWTSSPAVEDPLIYLLVHSDGEGVIHPEQGRRLAARLEQLIPALSVEGANATAARYEQFAPGLTIERLTLEWLEDKTRRFVKGLRVAAEVGEDVKFF